MGFKGIQLKIRRTLLRSLLAAICLLITSLPVQAARDDVLVIVNDNSLDSPQVGSYYAQQRDINPANIVHIKVPDSYFISWNDFRQLRDQLIHFMQLNTLDDPNLVPAVCADGEPPYYCQASMDQLRAHTRIRYLVTTRGVPTRMTVDGSTLYSPGTPTSVDNYLKYWLLNYFTDDVSLAFNEREIAFADGRSMRTVEPVTDRELIVGRIDGLNLDAAKALLDRALLVEGAGIYGTWYGTTNIGSWKNAETGTAIYPRSERSVFGWRYALGLWGEDRAECTDYQNSIGYLNFSGFLAEGKAPAHCKVQFNDDSDPALQSTQNISYPAPGNASSRMPLVVDALGYQGWLDGQATLGSFAALLNWRKNEQCTVTLCDDIADPVAAAACRANSSDIFGELNTDCVGVADGFMGYNHTSYPVSYLAIWPTSWFQSSRIGSSGWNNGGHGDVNQLAFPEVRNDDGFDDNNSLWFRNSDQVASPLCYAASDFLAAASVPCIDQQRLLLSQKIILAPQTLNSNSPQAYRVALRYKTVNFASSVDLRARLFIHESGAGDVLIDYGVQTLALLTPGDSAGWTAAEVVFTLDPVQHATASYDGIKITLDTPNAFAGDLGIDVVSVQEISSGAELVSNGSFSQGHRQAASGDHAATFLNRLGGVAAWGSVGHHQSGGSAFAANGLESMIYFLRGLPLGDAVWFNESQNSGLLYGDPLYSPVAVRLNPVNTADLLTSGTIRTPVELFGSTVNGRDPAQVNTSYSIDICPGDDFYACDQAQSWLATGISGTGGSENALLGTLDTTLLAAGQYTLRLQVTSLNITTGRSQIINDYYVAAVNTPPVAIDGNLKTLVNINGSGFLTASDADNGTLSYSIVSQPSNGFVGVDPATGEYLYRPNPYVSGADSFTFKANDGIADSNIATISVNIALSNDAPVANDSSLNTNEDVAANGVLSASDVDSDPLTYSLVNNASQGMVTITDQTSGSYIYTPNVNAAGADSFSFKVNDGMVDSNPATVSITINVAPVAVDSTQSVTEDIAANGVLNASDGNGDTLSYSIVSNGLKGSAVITDIVTGAYTYTPNPNVTGVDSFSFKVNDGLLDSNIATVTVNITAVNDAPVAANNTVITNEDTTYTFTAADFNYSDIDLDVMASIQITTLETVGALQLSGVDVSLNQVISKADIDTGNLKFISVASTSGTGYDSFGFSVNDGSIDSLGSYTLTVDVTAQNDVPTVANNTVTTNAVTGDSTASGGSLNWFFVVLLSLLSGLRFIPVTCGQYSRTGAVSI